MALRQAAPIFLILLSAVRAQFPPPPTGLKVIKSRFHEGVTISYKEPRICETTPGVRSFSGYVHLPSHSLYEPGEAQDYPLNTFFWFFESRNDPHNAPLVIWLSGGPGASSMFGALAENGPCFVGGDSNSTYLNEHSWNNEVNMLYIDQPSLAGFSYDILTNVTVDLLKLGDDEEPVIAANFSSGIPQQNNTFFVGTSGSQNLKSTANTTYHSAVALWHFAQTWFEEFPAYKPHDDRISLFTESYGGKYGPGVMDFFQKQNQLITDGTISGPGAHYLHLDTLGIINGYMDTLHQTRALIDFAWNNTYGIKAIDESQYNEEIRELTREGGIEDQIRRCQKISRKADPNEIGDIEKVNIVCSNASIGENSLIIPYLASNHGWFDVTHPSADPFPPSYFVGFLNRPWVQAALGVPVNFTTDSKVVSHNFYKTGDMHRNVELEQIAHLLDSGVKVALIYGDRDYACSHIGGLQASINVPFKGQESFNRAGFTPFVTNPFYSGGRTRQYGNFSYTRVFQAGHMVPAYQPETASKIFLRALRNKDIATGRETVTDTYATTGPSFTWESNEVLPAPSDECYSLMMNTCTDEKRGWLKDGTAMVKDYIVVGRSENQEQDSFNEFDGIQKVLAAVN